MNAPAILFDSFFQHFVDRYGYRRSVDIGSVVELDNNNRTIVEIVNIADMRNGDTIYTCKGLASEYRGSPCTLFVPAN